jgi:hypothetical protein
MGRACSTNGGEEECIKDIAGKDRKKMAMGRPKLRRVDNIKMDLKKDRMAWWYGLD